MTSTEASLSSVAVRDPAIAGWSISASRLILLVTLFIVLTGNQAFFGKLGEIYTWHGVDAAFMVSVGLAVACLLALLMALLSCGLPVRLVTSLFLLLAAVTSYFTDQFGTVVDTGMIRNVLETDAAEAGDLITGGLLLHLAVFAAIPIVISLALPLSATGYLIRVKSLLRLAAGACVVLIGTGLLFSSYYAGFLRDHKVVRYYSNPMYAIYSAGKILSASLGSSSASGAFRDLPAATLPADDSGKELIILVVGETARSDRFSLNGYVRETNPLLARHADVVSYTHVSACGTATAISVPCMFALEGRSSFDVDMAKSSENVLDVLQRAGVSILWRDNNSGSKGVAARVTQQDFRSPDLNPICDPECRDVGMLHGLQDYVDAQPGDILIVLHQMGNHGPAYFKRYPPQFEKFKPACHSEELSDCTNEEIGNAYDNAILYTDYFLDQVIQFLTANTPRYETAMLYVSDHGESLGEYGLYLHGMPWLLAPAEQKDVPVILWTGSSSDIDPVSALAARDRVTSHDAVFSSLLAAFEVKSHIPETATPLFRLADDDSM